MAMTGIATVGALLSAPMRRQMSIAAATGAKRAGDKPRIIVGAAAEGCPVG